MSAKHHAENRGSKEFGAHDPKGTECDFELRYATTVVLGNQRVRRLPKEGCQSCQNFRCVAHESRTQHKACLKFLLSRGVPPDVPDIWLHGFAPQLDL